MFDIYGYHFSYAGKDSSIHDLIIANMDTSRLSILQGERSVNTLFSKKNNTHYINNVSFSDEPVSFEAEIFTSDGSPIDESFLPEIERWLFCQSAYQKFHALDDYDFEPIYINCLFTDAERIESEVGVVGYKFTVIADSVMAWEEPITETFTFADTTSGIKTFTVTLNTDIADYTYPSVEFQIGSSGGSISLYNATDDSARITGFTSVPASARFKMDSSINYLPKTYYTMFNSRNFIRLLDGANNFAFIGNVTSIKITYQNRKLL